MPPTLHVTTTTAAAAAAANIKLTFKIPTKPLVFFGQISLKKFNPLLYDDMICSLNFPWKMRHHISFQNIWKVAWASTKADPRLLYTMYHPRSGPWLLLRQWNKTLAPKHMRGLIHGQYYLSPRQSLVTAGWRPAECTAASMMPEKHQEIACSSIELI